jgi:FkbM family methyltransferase
MHLRRIVELMSRGRSFQRRLPKRFGSRRIVVSPDAALRWLKPGPSAFEHSLLALADRQVRAGMVVWDVGANVGAFTFPAAHQSRSTVVAIEADSFLAGLLRQSATFRENRDLDVRVLNAAVSDHDGTAAFAISGRGRAASGLTAGTLSTQHGATREVVTVPSLTLDTLVKCLPAPDLIKVDIEGAEPLLLKGANEMLGSCRPAIYIEVTRETWGIVTSTLVGARYELFDGDQHSAPLDLHSGCPNNLFAVPTERVELARL